MAPSVVVVIREDPCKSARPVEALRIALGLAAGESALTIALLGEAPKLLAAEDEHILDGDILETYLPSLKQLGIPFLVPSGTVKALDLDRDFTIREAPFVEVALLVRSADRALIF